MIARIAFGLVLIGSLVPGCYSGRLMAWDVVNSERGATGNAGRSEALEYLNRRHASLAGLDLSHVWLDSIDLRGADMECVDLRHARIRKVDLSGANLSEARLDSAWLWEVNLTDANLFAASFVGAKVLYTDLRQADLRMATFDGATIQLVDFDGAELRRASLRHVDLCRRTHHSAVVCGVSFRGADLREATILDLQEWGRITDLSGANIARIRGAPTGFEQWAVETMGAVVEPSDAGWGAYREGLPPIPKAEPFSRWPERNWEAMKDMMWNP